MSDAAQKLQEYVHEQLEAARRELEALVSMHGERTIDNTLSRYDQILVYVEAAGHRPGLFERVHPDPKVRQAAEEATREVTASQPICRSTERSIQPSKPSTSTPSTTSRATISQRLCATTAALESIATRAHVRASVS